jgi:hypothetical protein
MSTKERSAMMETKLQEMAATTAKKKKDGFVTL